LAVVRDRLEAFAADLFGSLPRKDQRARGECYLGGLMLEGRRKSVEPIAARLGGEVHYQALHHFVAVSPWTGGRFVAAWLSGWSPRWSRRRGRPTTPASPKTAPTR
jgi:hypothetical protein